jgi:membrane fusion protein
MFNTLFRDEALSSTRREILGEVSFQAPRLGWLFFLLGIFVTVAAICILCFGRYTRRERVEGTLVPHGGILTMTSSEAGIVWRVFVKENQSVRAGQPLVEISVAQIGARTGNAQASIAEHLSSKLNGLSDDLASQQRAANIEREGLLSRLELLRSQALQVEEQVAIQ